MDEKTLRKPPKKLGIEVDKEKMGRGKLIDEIFGGNVERTINSSLTLLPIIL